MIINCKYASLPCDAAESHTLGFSTQYIYREGEKHSLNQMEAPGIKLHQMEADPLPAADSDDPHINRKTPPPPPPLLQTASLHISIHHMPKRVLRRFPPPLSDLARCESSPPAEVYLFVGRFPGARVCGGEAAAPRIHSCGPAVI